MIINTGQRTDIPAFYAKWFINRIKEGYVLVRNPYYPNLVTKFSLDPKVVDVIGFCTKNPRPMLPYIDELSKYKQFWYVTITTYGRDLEPNVPYLLDVIDDFKTLSLRLGKYAVGWRFTPIIITPNYPKERHLKAFEYIASRLAGYTKLAVFGFVDLYDKLKKNHPEIQDASDDDKVDIFLTETDYVFKYTDKDADVAMPLTDLGIDPDTDLADQYDFTRTTASTWQCCPGTLVYRRDIAKEVFGTDDPTAVGEKVKDWAAMKQTAEELKQKGYYAFASYADTFRLYGNNISNSWVKDGDTKVTVDPMIMQWINDSKEWLDAGYLNPTVKGQWNDDWNKAMGSQSKVFAFLFPAWGIDFTLKPNWDGEDGVWAVTNPPQEYNWGGSYIHVATGTDNPEHAKDIILAMTAKKDNLLKISQNYSDFTNTKSGMQEAANDDATYGSEFLGGQNPFQYFAPVAENIKIAPLSDYDQGCVELIQNSFSDYFQGKVDFEKAKSNFETAIKERYPDITEVVWPE